MSLMSHLEELRDRLKKTVVVVVATMIGAFVVREEMLYWVKKPLMEVLPQGTTLHVTGLLELFNVLDDLAPLTRSAANLSQALQSARELAKGDKLLIAMRDEGYEVSRSFELLFHDAKLALDYRIARSAEAQMAKATEMAVAQHKLNVLAAITFPLMAIATILGMNVVHGLENRSPGVFWAVLLAGIGVGMMAVYWVTSHSETGARMRNRIRSGFFE